MNQGVSNLLDYLFRFLFFIRDLMQRLFAIGKTDAPTSSHLA